MKSARGFTLVELLIVVAIIGIVAAIASASMLRARATANETSALAGLRAISSAQTEYSAVCGGGGYADALTTLGVPPPNSTVPFLSPDMTPLPVVRKSGYDTTIAPGAGAMAMGGDCNGTATVSGFIATSTPATFGSSGSRSFATTAAGTIWQVFSAVPPVEPFAAPASPVQ
jgi:prepilin-type N-terminal cleavage/methylation domain-containing protein